MMHIYEMNEWPYALCCPGNNVMLKSSCRSAMPSVFCMVVLVDQSPE